jgi:hypothetical protein
LCCFLKALTARLHLRGGCGVEPASRVKPQCAFLRRSQRRQPRQVEAGVSTAPRCSNHHATPQPAPATSDLPQKQGPPHRKPTPTDTPHLHDPPLLRTGPLTWLPDYRTIQTGASLRLGTQPPRPSPASITNPHRQSHTTRDLHASKAHNRRRRRSPLPAKESQIASASSFRPKLQPASQSSVRPPRHPIDQDKTWTLVLSELGHRRPAFRVAVHSANHLFSRCVATHQLKTLTEQGSYEHYTAFSRR